MVSSVAIRLGTDGSAQVKADFASIADSGDASAKRIVAAYERASDGVQAAIDKQNKAAEHVAAILPSQTQTIINRSVGTGYDGRQNANAAQFAALLAQQEQQAERVRAAIDPLYMAQKRYDAEIATAGDLLKQGVISEAEHAAALTTSGRALQEAKNALDGHSSAIGLNRQQTIIAQSAVLRFTDSIIAGRNPLTAFALEAHKGVEVLSSDDGGMAGGLAKVSRFVNPATIGVAALTAVVTIGAGAWYSYAEAVAKLDALGQGAGAVLGMTGQQLEANAEAASRNSNMTVGAARTIETEYVKMGGIGGDVLARLTALTGDFAAATGQDAKAAAEQLGKAMQDPAKGAEELTAKYGTLTQAQIDQIREMEQAGDIYGAQKRLLDNLGPAFSGAAERAEGFAAAFITIKKNISEAAVALGGFLSQNASTALATTLPSLLPLVRGAPPPPKADPNAAGNAFVAQALNATDRYTGLSGKHALEDQLGQVNRALNTSSDPKNAEALATLREQREALTRAVATYASTAQKAVDVGKAEAALAEARTPAEKQAAGEALARAQNEGRVVTSAQLAVEAMDRGAQARAGLDKSADKHAETLAREAAAQDASTQAALAAASAYLQSSAAGEAAEARQKAAAEAVKAGTSVDEQEARQKAANVASAIRDGDKATAALKDETAARQQVLAMVSAGTITADQMNDALSDQKSLLPLVNAQINAQGAAVSKSTEALKARTEALKDDHAAQEAMAALQGKSSNDNTIDGLRDQAEFAGDQSGAGRIEIARRAAEREAAQRFPRLDTNSPERQGYVSSQADVARQQQKTDQAKLFADTAKAQGDQSEQLLAQVGLIGKSAAAQDQVLDRLKAEQVLRAAGVDLSSEQARTILAGVAAEDQMKAHLAAMSSAWSEVTQFGDQFIGNVLNPSNWSNWGDMAKKELADIEQELMKLAVENPLKNMLFGESNPTLGGVGGVLSKLFGGGKGGAGALPAEGTSSLDFFGDGLPHFASGTQYAPGGLSEVGENGPELLNMPVGTRVTNAADTRRLLSAANQNGDTHNHFHLEGAVVTQDLLDQMNVIGARAAMQGAAGGAQQATRAAAVQRRRSYSGN